MPRSKMEGGYNKHCVARFDLDISIWMYVYFDVCIYVYVQLDTKIHTSMCLLLRKNWSEAC